VMTDILAAVRQHAEGHVAIHKANIDVYMTNPAGIGEHSDISEAVIEELKKIAEWDDVIEAIDMHWGKL
jgi:hypothetical protein